ncbi:ubiquitin carboxyl-terminal hydrolase isozyme L3 [Zopfochytrium polystomum]|nr:ubiquitin carboxyl-terminal hydrolase isozyme L3 [Zopfochytrium polystomum]
MARWLPLESNPDVMNKYIQRLGVSPTWTFTDVWGLDPDALIFVPRPVAAVLLLFPITPEYESFRAAEEARIRTDGQTVSPALYFVRQTIGNACGTIGLLHSLANNRELLGVGDGPLKRILDRTAGKTPEERAGVLEADVDLAGIHEESSREGQTAAPDADEEVDLHFVAFVAKDGHVYEMDGRKPFPINHGPCVELLSVRTRVLADGSKDTLWFFFLVDRILKTR